MKTLYQERLYRNCLAPANLVRLEVKIRESDLLIFAEGDLRKLAYEALADARRQIERHIEHDAEFSRTLAPYAVREDSAGIVREMACSSRKWGVGPMAAVAGAIAEHVGRALLAESRSVIVENGGDVFVSLPRKMVLRLYAGEESPFSDRVLLEIPESHDGLGVCTSSAVVGHSLSLGCADAVTAIADSASLADSAATAIANRISCPQDVDCVIDEVSKTGRLRGLVVAAGNRMGLWGDVRILSQER